MLDRHPALIARPADVSDMARTVKFARQHDLLTAVRGGGHSVSGNSTCDGCLVLDLSLMNEIRVDPEPGIVRAGGGATLGDVDAVTQEHGLAEPLVDGSQVMPYVKAQQIGDARLPPGELRHYWKAVNLMELSDAPSTAS